MIEMKEIIPLNNDLWVEALERSRLMCKLLETLSDHPVFDQTSELNNELSKIQSSLEDFYQKVGEISAEQD